MRCWVMGIWRIILFVKQKTSYELRISDWSSDVCSSDLDGAASSDDRAVADADRRHQRGVAAYEGAGADAGAVLQEAVVVAGDGAGADVGGRADRGIARSEERREGKECGSKCRSRG